jgi:hypothetical protein
MADYNPLGGTRFPYKSSTEDGWETRSYPDSTSFESAVGATYQELLDLLISKHKDYGPKNIADAPGGAINGLRVRMHDKLARINNLYEYMEDTKGFQPQHESIEDSFKDMANYAIIGLLVLRGQWDK